MIGASLKRKFAGGFPARMELLEARRLFALPQVDPTFAWTGYATLQNDALQDYEPGPLERVANGQLIATGTANDIATGKRVAIVSRFNVDGSPDAQFRIGNPFYSGNVPADRISAIESADDFVGFVATKHASASSLQVTLPRDGSPESISQVATPANALSNDELAQLPAGHYTFAGRAMTSSDQTLTLLTSDIGFNGLAVSVARFKEDGSLDTDFAGFGINTFDVNPSAAPIAIAVSPVDGSIAIVGQYAHGSEQKMWVLRADANGKLDATFGTNGVFDIDQIPGVDESAGGIAIGADNEIYVSFVVAGPDNDAGVRVLKVRPTDAPVPFGAGDFDGDGHVDFVLRNPATGENFIRKFSSILVPTDIQITSAPNPNVRLGAVTDLNRDGSLDLIWRNIQTGANYVWYMDGLTPTKFVSIKSALNVAWQLIDASDFDDDGWSDLLWRNAQTGQVALWYMHGQSMLGGSFVGTAGNLNMRPVSAGDFDGDGAVDILFRDVTSTRTAIWRTNGIERLTSAWLDLKPATSTTFFGKSASANATAIYSLMANDVGIYVHVVTGGLFESPYWEMDWR